MESCPNAMFFATSSVTVCNLKICIGQSLLNLVFCQGIESLSISSAGKHRWPK